MKISKIAAVCKRAGQAIIYNTYMVQWVSNGMAYYRLDGLPEITEDTLPAVFSYTDSDVQKMYITEDDMPEDLNIGDYCESEDIPLVSPFISIIDKGHNLDAYSVMVRGKLRLVLIDRAYMKPFDDCQGEVGLYYREYNDGGFVAVTEGLMTVGIVTPSSINDENLLIAARQLYELAEKRYYALHPPEVDERTGELI